MSNQTTERMTLVQSLRMEAEACRWVHMSSTFTESMRDALALIGRKMAAAADRIEELEKPPSEPPSDSAELRQLVEDVNLAKWKAEIDAYRDWVCRAATALERSHEPAAEAIIDRCDNGHVFAKLDDHPKRDGRSRCPHCLAIGLDAARFPGEPGGGAVPLAEWQRLVKWIVNHPYKYGGDAACVQCYPHSDMLKPGFECGYHLALRHSPETKSAEQA